MTTGPSISERIAEQITEAWQAVHTARAELDSDPWRDKDELGKLARRWATAKGRVIGLSQALATLRHAPNVPTSQQVQEIAQEHRPGGTA